MDIIATRIANARIAIERAGGVGKVATKMGYGNASFLVQMFGPNPSRAPSEKTMRRMEKALGLPNASLDGSVVPAMPPASAPLIDAAQLRRVIDLVGRLAAEESVKLTNERFASLVTMAYEESAEHAGQPREAKIRQVVQLLKGH